MRLRYVAWVLSGAIMGMGGAIWAQYNLAFDPKQFFFTQTFNLLAMVVVGGLASVSGAVIGAVDGHADDRDHAAHRGFGRACRA